MTEKLILSSKMRSIPIHDADRYHPCECPLDAVDHGKGACMGRPTEQYLREGKPNRILWLCYRCVINRKDRKVE